MVKKIISGGQTGADQGGLRAAAYLGLETGGKAPLGFRTEVGPLPELRELYNLQESWSPSYLPRTKHNVLSSDGTVIFGDIESPGSRMTKEMCRRNNRPFFVAEDFNSDYLILFKFWVIKNNIVVLNVAGNRESKNPGIGDKVFNFLTNALGVDSEGA